jgi:hypothetical protein
MRTVILPTNKFSTSAAAGGRSLRLAPIALMLAASIAAFSTANADEDSGELLQKLGSARYSLSAGVAQAEKQHGSAISAKFELKDGALMLSVYTAEAGLGKDAEHNVLIELIGDATKPAWTPEKEVFEDKAHLTRSAMHLTLVQVSGISLPEAITKAQSALSGTVYSVIPAVKGRAPLFAVKVATKDGRTVNATVDGTTGKVDTTS